MLSITSASDKELYAALGVHEDATSEEIHAAYILITKRHHPDLHGGVENDIFKNATHAHTVLMDPIAREIYDTTGEADKSIGEAIRPILNYVTNYVEEGIGAKTKLDLFSFLRKA